MFKKNLFLKISKYSQENTSVGVSYIFPMSTWTCGCLFQCWYKTRSYFQRGCFLEETKFDFFSIVTRSILFVFCFRLYICASNILDLLVPLETEGTAGSESWYTPLYRAFPQWKVRYAFFCKLLKEQFDKNIETEIHAKIEIT